MRGQGLDFDDFREYTPGDDPRFIDWKVTARMNSPFVRRFREEREQAVILAVDVSGSMHYASSAARASKLDYAAEVAAVLAFSAAQSGDKCGLLIYGNSHSHYIPPAKGIKQTLRIVREIVASKNDGADQSIADVARQLVPFPKGSHGHHAQRLLSEHNKAALGQLNFKHDFVPIRIADPMELHLPDAGRVILKDPETGKSMFLNLARQDVREAHANVVHLHREKWTQDFRRLGIDFLDLQTTDNFCRPSRPSSPGGPPLRQNPSASHASTSHLPDSPHGHSGTAGLPHADGNAVPGRLPSSGLLGYVGHLDHARLHPAGRRHSRHRAHPQEGAHPRRATQPGGVRHPGHHDVRKPTLRQARRRDSTPCSLRKYLVGETKDPALYETQQEFNRRADALTALPSELQGPTRDLLDRMASLKYEPDTPENDSLVNELADDTVQLINDIEADAHRTKEETDLVVKKPSPTPTALAHHDGTLPIRTT